MSSTLGILTKTFFTLDYRDKENSGKKKFIGIILSYLFANFVLSINNFIAFDKESFIFLAFSNGLFLLVFIVLNDFGELLFVKRHREIISSLPVSNTKLISAKLFSAFLFLAVYALIIIIPQVFLFCLYDTNYWEVIFFIKANFISMFFVLGVVIFIYTVSYKLFAKKSNFILYFLQFVFFFYVITVSSLASRQALGKSGILNFDFVHFLPQYCFSLSVHNPLLLLGLFLLTLLVYVLYFFYIRKNYGKISSVIYGAIETPKSKKNKFNIFAGYNNFISRYFVKNEEEKASYYLTLNQLSNSRTMKLKFIPLTFLSVVVGIIALFTDSYKFVSNNGEAGSILILTPSVTFVVIMCFRLLVTATKIEDENSPGIRWIYSTLPVSSIKRLQNANIKFVFANFIVPVSVILFLILSVKFQAVHLLLNMLYLLSASYMINSIFLLIDKVFPYSLESTKYNSASKLGEVLFIMLIGVAIFIAQIFIFENVIFVIIAVILFYVISFLMKQKSFTLKRIK